MRGRDEMCRETYLALRMAAELRQIITDKLGGVPALGLPGKCYPIPPYEDEGFTSAAMRIFGDYVYLKVVNDVTMDELRNEGMTHRGDKKEVKG